jgi:hypothetical protein
MDGLVESRIEELRGLLTRLDEYRRLWKAVAALPESPNKALWLKKIALLGEKTHRQFHLNLSALYLN